LLFVFEGLLLGSGRAWKYVSPAVQPEDVQPEAMTNTTALPSELSAAISALLHQRPRRELAERAERVSGGFRARRTTRETILDRDDALAYAISRLPATYAATAATLTRLSEEAPGFRPRTFLDLGCGLGAASFAAVAVWPEIEHIAMLDRSTQFLALAETLAAGSSHHALAKAERIECDMAALSGLEASYDLIVMSYCATELPEAALTRTVDAAWRRCTGALVFVDPGTPRDFSRLMTIRAALSNAGAHLALPCPHARPCPLTPPDWCHFAVRLPRSRDHKLVKNADAPFEDEKYGCLVATRDARLFPPASARILQPPRTLKYGISLKLCCEAGIRDATIVRSNKSLYAKARRWSWGDSIEIPAET
jgi:ribosomal protein RSM22 (predicted rRNA methylase)